MSEFPSPQPTEPIEYAVDPSSLNSQIDLLVDQLNRQQLLETNGRGIPEHSTVIVNAENGIIYQPHIFLDGEDLSLDLIMQRERALIFLRLAVYGDPSPYAPYTGHIHRFYNVPPTIAPALAGAGNPSVTSRRTYLRTAENTIFSHKYEKALFITSRLPDLTYSFYTFSPHPDDERLALYTGRVEQVPQKIKDPQGDIQAYANLIGELRQFLSIDPFSSTHSSLSQALN